MKQKFSVRPGRICDRRGSKQDENSLEVGAAKCSTGEIKMLINKCVRRGASEASGGATGEFYRATGEDLCLVFIPQQGR